MISIVVDHRVESPNRLMREFWRQRVKRRRSEWAATANALGLVVPPVLPAQGEPAIVVRFVRLAPALVDDDNLAAGFKTPRDAVAAWLGCGDSPRERRVAWAYDQQILREKLPIPICGPRPKYAYAARFRIEIGPVHVAAIDKVCTSE